MPCLRILTNVPSNQIPRDFVNKIIPVLAKVVRKDAEKFLCVISGDCQVSFGGDSSAPGAAATLESIGHVEPADNQLIAREVSQFVHEELGIHPDRSVIISLSHCWTDLLFFMSIYDLKGTNICKGGNTLK